MADNLSGSDLKFSVRVVTMGSVRETPRKSIPLDALTNLTEADELAHRLASELDPENPTQIERLHLIGDVSMLAVHVAKATNATLKDPSPAIGRLRSELLSPGEPSDFSNELKVLTGERVKMAEIGARILGRPMETCSAIDFLRYPDNRAITERMMDIVAMAYADIATADVDLARMKKECSGRPIEPGHEEDAFRMRILAKRTLPTRLRKLSDDEQLQQSFYAAVEGALAATLSGRGDYYLTYKGSDRSKSDAVEREGTIMENMRLFVKAAVYRVLSDIDFTRQIGSHLIVNPLLDGVGFRKSAGKPVIRCDPWTLDNTNGGISTNGTDGWSPLQKIPLVIYNPQDAQLRPASMHEINEVLAVSESGSASHVILHNLGSIVDYLRNCEESIDHGPLKEALSRNRVEKSALEKWFRNAESYLLKRRESKDARTGKTIRPEIEPRSHIVNPLFPGGKMDLMAEIIHEIAEDMVRGLQ